ncbi:SSI family serine proteinase inhibitor [Actinoplanes sp. NPDC049548]|uniref:SSI family serine proteinase inhibitor n=1 Tax=Actinoplanes sp. NPDC049548 TaxID=3155152 RepID=UPI0034454E60
MTSVKRAAVSLFAFCAAGAGILAAATPAAATTADTSRSTLALMVQGPNSQQARITLLTCGPAAGTHPRSADACATVATVDGDLAALDVQPDGFCTREYQPVTATATGFWQGRPVLYGETFPNRCEMLRETGALFDF